MRRFGKTVLFERPPIDQYFLKIARVVADRSTCRRHKVGAVAVKDKFILATGYNGAPAGLKDCLELGCLRENIKSGTQQETCRGVHAEQNAIIQASLHGISIEGSTVYCTHTPCILCAKMLVNAKIERFVSSGEYADNEFHSLFKQAGIKFNYLVDLSWLDHIPDNIHATPEREVTDE
jgi:dCMP deaminase